EGEAAFPGVAVRVVRQVGAAASAVVEGVDVGLREGGGARAVRVGGEVQQWVGDVAGQGRGGAAGQVEPGGEVVVGVGEEEGLGLPGDGVPGAGAGGGTDASPHGLGSTSPSPPGASSGPGRGGNMPGGALLPSQFRRLTRVSLSVGAAGLS